ncbi:MAG: alpha-galactosidase [Candidatus Hydrogenedentes bacterium]|nr:alpha-galactosidase [Candidatus Hydrogenedentota bacterium]
MRSFVGSVLCAFLSLGALALELNNGTVAVHLGQSEKGEPCIASVKWIPSASTVFKELHNDTEGVVWRQSEDAVFLRAEAEFIGPSGLPAKRIVELTKSGSLLRTYVELTNPGSAEVAVATYPIWEADWSLPKKKRTFTNWHALSFEPYSENVSQGKKIEIGSRLHSSDDIEKGVNPYWVISDGKTQLYFALAWCGGWQARLSGTDTALHFSISLPKNETQLKLAPSERIVGPIAELTIVRESEERLSRASWLSQRCSLARALFGGPAPSYPFTYNHWYTTRFAVDGPFLQRQLDNLDPYSFDYFIVDAGWYRCVGDWTPDPAKFAPGQFEGILAEVRKKGPKIGIWTCPQFMRVPKDVKELPKEVDQPGFYRKFIDGHLIDMAGTDFTSYLLNHVAALRSQYQADWWKYDQDFFTDQTRHGVMKNVVALQNALGAVRAQYPELMIENCQSGGRMLNEFTFGIAQNQWIRDGGSTGPKHARAILREVLGSLYILPPWTSNRWINNPDQNDPNDDEFTRLYCRSAFPGTWGIVADLAKIQPRQRDIIVKEVANYRRLTPYKEGYVYDVLYPEKDSSLAGIVFYAPNGNGAAILLCRWDGAGAFTQTVPLSGLTGRGHYRVTDADASSQSEPQSVSGRSLHKEGIAVTFDTVRQSALLFIDPE